VGFFRDWSAMRAFGRLPAAERELVFYAEGGGSWPHLGPLVQELTGPHGRTVSYLTSDPGDPALQDPNPRVRAFCIGAGVVRTWLFTNLEAGVLVLTMPDLECFHVKRSRAAPVHYVYVFHSLVSTHMIYREAAFDHYDTLLCSGPHHVTELRAAEALRGLPPRRLVEHGYGRLDTLLADRRPRPVNQPAHVLVAPSWGPQGLLETRGVEATQALLASGLRVTVRPHPMTRRKWPQALAQLVDACGSHPRFSLDEDMRAFESLRSADVLVSDWSGAALEFAFGFERPVVFVDVPRKVNNPDYERLPPEPLEVSIRPELGAVLAADALAELPEAVERLLAEGEALVERIRAARGRWVFNPGRSAGVGAEAVLEAAGAR
jgi:YidC/Oxa1 family membrane protein insertase